MKALTLLALATSLASASIISRQISNIIGGGSNLKDLLRLGGGNNFVGGGKDLNGLAALLGQSGGFQGLSSSDLNGLGLGINNLGSSLQGFGIGINNFDINSSGDVQGAINRLLGAMCVSGLDSNIFGGIGQQQQLFMLQELAGLFQLQQRGFNVNAGVINGILNGGNIFGNQLGGGFGFGGGAGGGFNVKGFKRAAVEQKKTLKRTTLRRPAKRQECNSGVGAGGGAANRTEGERVGVAAPAQTVTVGVAAPAATNPAGAVVARREEEDGD